MHNFISVSKGRFNQLLNLAINQVQVSFQKMKRNLLLLDRWPVVTWRMTCQLVFHYFISTQVLFGSLQLTALAGIVTNMVSQHSLKTSTVIRRHMVLPNRDGIFVASYLEEGIARHLLLQHGAHGLKSARPCAHGQNTRGFRTCVSIQLAFTAERTSSNCSWTRMASSGMSLPLMTISSSVSERILPITVLLYNSKTTILLPSPIPFLPRNSIRIQNSTASFSKTTSRWSRNHRSWHA